MRTILAILALAGMTSLVTAQECVPVDRLIEQATEFKREYGYVERGPMLDALAAIFSAQSGHDIKPDRVMVIDVGSRLVLAFQIGEAFCGFMLVVDEDAANAIRLAVFGRKI